MGTLEIIRDLCNKNGMTLSGLEKKLGYGNTSLIKSKNISSNRIIEIANFFHVSVDYLLGLTPDPDFRPNRITIDTSRTADKITQKYTKEDSSDFDDYISSQMDGEESLSQSFDIKQINNALILYQKYQNASPEVRSAVELLLKTQSRES